jgi:hypothetical protein
MTREIFAELTQRLDVRPISWNKGKKLLYGTSLPRRETNPNDSYEHVLATLR